MANYLNTIPAEIRAEIYRQRIHGDVAGLWKIHNGSDADMFVNNKSPIVDMVIRNNIGDGLVANRRSNKHQYVHHTLAVSLSWVAGWAFAQTDDYRVALSIALCYLFILQLCADPAAS